MRLWDWRLLEFLPKSQLLSQKRECDLIWKDISNGKRTNHILINYIWEYETEYQLSVYYQFLKEEFEKRGYKFKENGKCCTDVLVPIPFERHHTKQYLLQNFMNLEEKYFCGQKDFDRDTYLKLWNFVNDELNGLLQEISKELKGE